MSAQAQADPDWASAPGPADDPARYVPDGRVVPLHAAIGVLALRYAELNEASGPLATLLFHLTQHCVRPTQTTLSDLRAQLLARGLHDVRDFLDGTLDRIETPDDLIDLFLQFDSCVNSGDTNETINRASPLGLYLREVVLAFHTLPFSAVARLFDDVLQFRAGTLPVSICRPAILRQFLRQRAVAVERSGGESSFSKSERLLSEMMDWRQARPPELYYVQFLNCMLHREFEGAISNLHLFFDLAGCRNQAAVLSLALLHFHMGHTAAAHQTLRETVRIAQQNNDAGCLLQVLSLLAPLENVKSGHTSTERRLLLGTLSSMSTADGPRSPGREAFASLDANNIVALTQARLDDVDGSEPFWPLVQAALACVRDATDPDHVYAGVQLARSRIWAAFADRHLAAIAAQYAARFAPDSLVKTQAIRTLSQLDAGPLSSASRRPVPVDDPRDVNARERGPLRCAIDGALAEIQLLIWDQRWRDAWRLSQTLLSDCRLRASSVNVARTLILQAQIAEEMSGSVQLAPVVLQASYLASGAGPGSLPIALESRLKIAALQLSLDAPELALRTVRQSLPDVLEQLPPDSIARAYLTMAKSALRIWRDTASGDEPRRDAALKQAIRHLNEAREFGSCSSPGVVTEIWYLLAHCWHSARRPDKRDRCAEEFLRCRRLIVC